MATLRDDEETERIVAWVKNHGFQRVALQFPDTLLSSAPHIGDRLRKALPGRLVFVLGDSSYGGGGVDEVGAQHYGADCVVRFGQSDQERGGALPVLFVFGDQETIAAEKIGSAAKELASEVVDYFKGSEVSQEDGLVLVCDLSFQDSANRLGQALEASLKALASASESWQVFIADPKTEAAAGEDTPSRWRDWRWGALPLGGAWWVNLGPLTAAAAGRQKPLQVCGRPVRCCSSSVETFHLPQRCGFVYVGAAGSALERRLLLRHGQSKPVWRLEPENEGLALQKLSSQSLLLKRYRFVESAKSAASVGLLLVAAGGPTAQGLALAERLEALLRRAGRKSYRLVVGQPSAEKLGNFIGIECYVLLAGPEQFPWDARDLMVPICTPYELEVALGAREWSGDYVTDLEELLNSSGPLPPGAPATEVMAVQTLGGRMRHFGSDDSKKPTAKGNVTTTSTAAPVRKKRPPAAIQPGLNGVPWKYTHDLYDKDDAKS
eukprot:TRINITY_DN51089_c0_g1_i1.p1 TRINITY_DN51089_c0_g1~~TRINITY_DN51089_c0_g1_i1.p1  ORF type:complete len:493 (+),score=95.29 TRINITY_DN51089_c0_g1_i1:40-1518(+)